MGLLDGDVAAFFSETFSGLYLDATLHRATLTDDGSGGGAVTWTDEPVKAQLDAATQAMRDAPGYVDTDMRILVLAHGVAEINADSQITVAGKRWSIANVGRDPALAYYDLHGRLA